MRTLDFFSLPNPSSRTMVLAVYSASNTNVYQKVLLGVKRCRCLRLTTSLPSVSRSSGQSGSLDVSLPHRPPRHGIGIALLFFTFTVVWRSAHSIKGLLPIAFQRGLNWPTKGGMKVAVITFVCYSIELLYAPYVQQCGLSKLIITYVWVEIFTVVVM
jgi:hypothetical protein